MRRHFSSQVSASPPAILAAAAALCLSLASPAQQPQPVTLDEVLTSLQNNLDTYERSIPSFLCDEHLDSTIHQYGARGASADNYQTVAESVFRLKRELDPDGQSITLAESREIKIIDGRPANGRDIDAPTMISGAFSGGLALVSKDEQACMSYQLEPIKRRRPIIVRFASLPADRRPATCIIQEDGSGRVLIDPASMQIQRIEIKIPHHVMYPQFTSGGTGPRTITKWEVQVDYSPVHLDNRIFWLPRTIDSTSSNSQVEWTFRASYRNYHMLEVTSRIIVPR
ncbi:MAG TPA: hypothetical protein VG714_07110 [Acidobacteriaceae bacterium]|nr:hypothetical protein [Acidobacteriaceae bacterium]